MNNTISNKKLIILFGALLIVGMWFFVWKQIDFEYKKEVKEASREGMNLAKLYEDRIDKILNNVDSNLLALREAYQREGVYGPSIRLQMERMRSSGLMTQIGIADEHGILRSLLRQDAEPYDISDRDYFINQRDNLNDEVFIGRTIFGRQSGEIAIPLSRPIINTDGSFGGIVVISISPSFFTDSFKQIELGPGSFISIVGMDGIIRVLEGPNTNLQGEDIVNHDSVYLSAKENTDGIVHSRSASDKIMRIHAFRALPKYSLFINVGIANQDILEALNHRRVWYFVMAFFVTVFIISFCKMLIRNSTQQQKLHSQISEEANRQQVFQDITSSLVTNSEDVDSLLNTVVQDAPRFVGTPHGQIAMVDVNRTTWTIKYAAGICTGVLGMQQPISEGLIGEVILRGEMIYVADYITYTRQTSALDSFRSVVALPLMTGNKIDGVLIAAWSNAIPRPSEATLNILRQYAQLASVALARANAYDEIKLRNAEINRLNGLYLVGEMAAGIAHEIRNPMTTVRGYLQFLQRKDVGQKYETQFETMIEELDRANEIITEFLLLAKNRRINLVDTNLNNIINAIYPLIQADAFVLNKKIQKEFDDIPNLLLDENEIRQLILNIVRNGLDAMDSNGSITIKTALKDNSVMLSIKDEGPGIDPHILKNCGIPFNTTKENGTGLGLPICYSIADRHKAKIEILSTPQGTTFIVYFQLNL